MNNNENANNEYIGKPFNLKMTEIYYTYFLQNSHRYQNLLLTFSNGNTV